MHTHTDLKAMALDLEMWTIFQVYHTWNTFPSLQEVSLESPSLDDSVTMCVVGLEGS